MVTDLAEQRGPLVSTGHVPVERGAGLETRVLTGTLAFLPHSARPNGSKKI